LLNRLLLYGEYEGLNGAALYKMEVAGFGGEDLNESLALARRTPVRTFEQRAIMYHDWGRVNVTFNFINETSLESGGNDFGYAWGLFRQASYMSMDTGKDMAGMAAMPKKKTPPVLSLQRLIRRFVACPKRVSVCQAFTPILVLTNLRCFWRNTIGQGRGAGLSLITKPGRSGCDVVRACHCPRFIENFLELPDQVRILRPER